MDLFVVVYLLISGHIAMPLCYAKRTQQILYLVPPQKKKKDPLFGSAKTSLLGNPTAALLKIAHRDT
jgi:hypothetical protein